jgi:integral membrane sensor domain MASE1
MFVLLSPFTQMFTYMCCSCSALFLITVCMHTTAPYKSTECLTKNNITIIIMLTTIIMPTLYFVAAVYIYNFNILYCT